MVQHSQNSNRRGNEELNFCRVRRLGSLRNHVRRRHASGGHTRTRHLRHARHRCCRRRGIRSLANEAKEVNRKYRTRRETVKSSIFAALALIALGASACLAGFAPAPQTPEPGTFIMLATAAAGGA